MKIKEIVIEEGLIGKLGTAVGKTASAVKTAKSIGNTLAGEWRKGRETARSAMSFSGNSQSGSEPVSSEEESAPEYEIKQSLTNIANGNKPLLKDRQLVSNIKNKIKLGTQKINVDTQQAVDVLDKILKNQQLDQNDLSLLTQISSSL
jgi:hypothetical protein